MCTRRFEVYPSSTPREFRAVDCGAERADQRVVAEPETSNVCQLIGVREQLRRLADGSTTRHADREVATSCGAVAVLPVTGWQKRTSGVSIRGW